MESENTKDVLLNLLKNPEIMTLYKKYQNNEELLSEILSQAVTEIIAESNPYRWEPVLPETFLTDPYYLGVNPETGVGVCETLYDVLKQDFCKIHDPDSDIDEVILTGSIGYGKSFFMELSILWQAYKLSCFKNPQKYFGLGQQSKISIMIISVTEKQSKKNIFSTVRDMIRAVPYFQENFMFDEKRASDSLLFPNNIEIFNGTSAQSSAIGLNIYSATLDEANFFKKVTKSKRAQNNDLYDEALVLYNSLKRRQESRYLKNGRKPGILYIGSSKVYPNDFTAQRIEIAQKSFEETGKLTSYIMDYNLWKVNRKAYSEEEFQVEIGGMNSRSRILEGHETDIKGKVINVPMDFYDKFAKDIDNAIRDIAGEALFTVMPFIGNKNKIGEMFTESLNRIFSVDKATLSPKPEFLAIENILKVDIPHKERPRYVSVDIGLKNDRFGFVMGYIEDMVNVEREYFDVETQSLKTITERMPKVNVEMILEVVKEKEFGEVELSRVRFLIFQLIKAGYKIRYFSADGFQSADMQQILRRKGIKWEYISMDRTPEPYECFRTAMYENRIQSVYHPTLERELNELERDYSRGKIDHPPHGCFLGDTKIKLLNGTNRKIEDLVGKEKIWIYGCKPDGRIVPVCAKKIWKTKTVTEYIKLELSNGEIIRCTPEHKFMLLNGDYKEANQLETTDILMSFSNWNKTILTSELITVDIPVSVYDIEVPETNNFALTAGIFVHNSKDLADAIGQMVYYAHINPVYSDLSLLPIVGDNGINNERISDVQEKEHILNEFNKWARGVLHK